MMIFFVVFDAPTAPGRFVVALCFRFAHTVKAQHYWTKTARKLGIHERLANLAREA